MLLTTPAKSFRTAADDPAFRGTAKVRWSGDVISYRIHRATPPGITVEDLQEVAARAFHRWSMRESARVQFELGGLTDEGAAPEDGINTVQFLRSGWTDKGFDPSAAGTTEMGYARDATGQWRIVEADIYLNGDDHDWILSGDADGQRDLDSVLTHEGGHMLGLWHPCEIDGALGAPECGLEPTFLEATMYPVYRSTQSTLAADDMAGVEFLYPSVSCDVGGCPSGSVCEPVGCVETCGASLCGPDEHCTPDGCWPNGECYGPRCDVSCARGSDCEPGQACVAQQCLGRSTTGEDCDDSTQCQSGLCAEQGFCVASCSDCAEGTCELRPDGTATCQASRFPLGATCQVPEDCIGGECLTGAQAENICTRNCAADGDCPDAWSCTSVDSSPVCAPTLLEARGGGGCAVGAVSDGQAKPKSLFLALAALTLAARRRRARDLNYASRRRS